jgi:hypothetical protein
MSRSRALSLSLVTAVAVAAGAASPVAAQTTSFTLAVTTMVQQACQSSTSASLVNTYAGTLVLAAAQSLTNATYINAQIAASCPNLKTAYQSASTGTLQLSAESAKSVTPHGNCGFGNGGDDGVPGKSGCEDKDR